MNDYLNLLSDDYEMMKYVEPVAKTCSTICGITDIVQLKSSDSNDQFENECLSKPQLNEKRAVYTISSTLATKLTSS